MWAVAVSTAFKLGFSIAKLTPHQDVRALLRRLHPVTTEHDNREHLETTLKAVAALDMPTIWFWSVVRTAMPNGWKDPAVSSRL